MSETPAHRYRLSAMTDPDLVAYEQDLLAYLREAFAEGRSTVPSDRFAYVLGVEVQGHFPDARILIRYREPRLAQDRLVELDAYPTDESGDGVRDDLDWPHDRGYMIASHWEDGAFLHRGRPVDDQPDEKTSS